jgi:hypothetical protein
LIENADFIFKKIQRAFEQGKISWRQHALARMLERNISRKDVFTAIKAGNVIESYPESNPYPGLLIAYADEEISIHVVASWDSGSDFAYVITSYIPDDIHFEKNGKTRKERTK